MRGLPNCLYLKVKQALLFGSFGCLFCRCFLHRRSLCGGFWFGTSLSCLGGRHGLSHLGRAWGGLCCCLFPCPVGSEFAFRHWRIAADNLCCCTSAPFIYD